MLIRGNLDYGFKFNGLYQQLSYLYAAAGNSERALQCLDTLIRYSQPNYLEDYANGIDNATNVASVFYLNARPVKELDLYVQGYCERKRISEEDFYKRVLGRTLHSNTTAANLHLYWWMDSNANINLQFSSRGQLTFFFIKYRDVVQSTIKDVNERDFLLALSYKNEGILKSLNQEKPGSDEVTVKQYFDRGVKLFQKLDSKYLDQEIPMIGVAASDEILVPRKYLFIYPDLKVHFHPLEPRSFFFFYSTGIFMEYVLDNHLFDAFYSTPAALRSIEDWLRDYNSKMFVPRAFVTKLMRPEILKKLDAVVMKPQRNHEVDANWLYLYLGWFAQQEGDTVTMLNAYHKIQTDNILNTLRSKEFANNINNQSFRLIAYAVKGLAEANHFDDAYNLVKLFKKPINRSSLYAFAAIEFLRAKKGNEASQRLIDSAYVELDRVGNITTGQPHRQVLAFALAMQDPIGKSPEAYGLIKNLGGKFNAIQRICYSHGFHGELYAAQANIPQFISSTDEAVFLRNILSGYGDGDERKVPDEWLEFEAYYITIFTRWINYIDESS